METEVRAQAGSQALHHLLCPTPSSRSPEHAYGHPGALGSRCQSSSPRCRGPMASGPGPQQAGGGKSTLASQPGLQHSQSPAFCPRDSQGPPGPPLHPYPSPREPHWQESHPEWGSSLMPSTNSCKGNLDVHDASI